MTRGRKTDDPPLRLVVLLAGRVIGALNRASVYAPPTFAYEEEYVRVGSTPLSVRMPIRAEPYPERTVTPWLEGLLPEQPEARSRMAQQLGASRDSAFDLLAGMGRDCPGAVQFVAPDGLAELRERSHDVESLTSCDIAARLRDLRVDGASWTMPDEHWSLPGQQPKFALARIEGAWFEARGSAATTHILKPGIGRLHHQALVEHVTMRAAYLIGLNVARTAYMHFEDETAIVVERFDRVVDGEDVTRVHQEDFCQATGTMPARKYEAPNGPGMAEFMKVLANNSTSLRADADALADFVTFNYLAGAPDGHSKNISLVLRPGLTKVAPLYDLATASPYDRKGDAFLDIAVSIGGRRKLDEVMPKNWDKAAEVLRLPADVLRAKVVDMATRLPEAMDLALDEVDDEATADIRPRTMDRLERHCETVLHQLAAG